MATTNPFYDSKIQILQEAFPSTERSVIEDVLLNTNADLNQTFEILLEINNGVAQPMKAPTSSNPFDMNSTPNPALNPFLQENPPPLTVRQELAQWRRELREEGRQRLNSTRKNHTSTPNLSISGHVRSLWHNTENGHFRTSSGRYQRPLRTDHSLNGLTHSTSAPNVSHTFQNGSQSSSPSNTRSPPPLPARRQRHHTADTRNPFCSSDSRSISTPSYIPSQNEPHHESSPNPFEETDLPPPAYNEIQRDRIINAMP
ncbi:hypothetical protein EDC96DRAFT_512508 [Choanephora cucurbitarum]|nr:hypothetical protein EDC96DRAFT_512508 [Choanephora cucurbitarum]